jgi:hypothetical protein
MPITPEDYKLAVDTIARMIAQWWDAHGRQLPDTEQHTTAPTILQGIN